MQAVWSFPDPPSYLCTDKTKAHTQWHVWLQLQTPCTHTPAHPGLLSTRGINSLQYLQPNMVCFLWVQRSLLISGPSCGTSEASCRRYHSNCRKHLKRKTLTFWSLPPTLYALLSTFAVFLRMSEIMRLSDPEKQLPWEWWSLGQRGASFLSPGPVPHAGWCWWGKPGASWCLELEVDWEARATWALASALPPSSRLSFLKLPKGLTLGPAASNLTFSVRVKNVRCLIFRSRMDCFFKRVSHFYSIPDIWHTTPILWSHLWARDSFDSRKNAFLSSLRVGGRH